MRTPRMIFVFAILALAISISCQSGPAEQVEPPVPVNPPSIAKTDVNPEAALPDYAGKVVVAEVAAVGCALSLSYCEKLEKMNADLEKRGAAVVKIDVETEETAKQFYAAHPVPFKHIADASGEIKKKLGVFLIPTLVVIDKYGYLRFRGKLVPEELTALVDKLAAETRPVPEAAIRPAFKQGDAAIDFTADTIDGEKFNLLETAKSTGRVVIFFNSST